MHIVRVPAGSRRLVRLTLLLALVYGCRPSPSIDVEQVLSDAELQFAKARSPKEYQAVAATYQQLIDADCDASSIWYNQGLAFIEAGEKGRAIASLRRAERLRPRDRNIQTALVRAGVDMTAVRSSSPIVSQFFRAPYRLSPREKCWIVTSIVGTTMLLGCVTLFAGSKRGAWWVNSSGTVLAAFFFAAIAIDLYRDQWQRHAVILHATSVRRGAADVHALVWPTDIAPGTEVTVKETRDRWSRIEWADHGEGWVPSRSIAVY